MRRKERGSADKKDNLTFTINVSIPWQEVTRTDGCIVQSSVNCLVREQLTRAESSISKSEKKHQRRGRDRYRKGAEEENRTRHRPLRSKSRPRVGRGPPDKSISADYPTKINSRQTKNRSKSRRRRGRSVERRNTSCCKFSAQDVDSTLASPNNTDHNNVIDKKERQRRQRSDALRWVRRSYY